MIRNKVRYLLSKYTNIEWSGPAWYSYKLQKNGFIKSIKLIHFVVLDIGTASATEWEAEDLHEIYPKLIQKYPELEDCIRGNIHSHHNMGAFLSATDEELLITNLCNDFYPSLVVAHENMGGKDPYAFGISYHDQYGIGHPYIFDSEDIKVKIPKLQVEDEWKEELKDLKPKTQVMTTYHGNQAHLFNVEHHRKTKAKGTKTYDQIMGEYGDQDGYGIYKQIEDELEDNGMDINGSVLDV